MATVTRPPFWVPRPSDDFIAPLLLVPQQALTLYLRKTATVETMSPFYIPRPSDDFISSVILQPQEAATLYLRQTIRAGVGTLSPVYVPRPSDDPAWAPAAETLNTSLSILLKPGGPGKPLQLRFTAFIYDDPSHWLIEQPQQAQALIILTAGQVVRPPSVVPRPSDDPHYLIAQPQQSVTLQMLTIGKPPFKRWAPHILSFDDASHYLIAQPQQAVTLQIFTVGGKPPFLRWAPYELSFDDAPMWQGAPARSWIISELTQTAMPLSAFYTMRPAEIPDWAPALENLNMPTSIELKGPNPFIPDIGRFYGYDDAAVWSGSPLNAKLIRDLTAAGQPPTKRWLPSYTLDDPSVWSGSPLAAVTLVPELVTKPFLKAWSFYQQDDAAVWSGSPLNADSMFMLVEKGPPFFKAWAPYSLTQDDASPWQRTTVRNMVQLAVPFVPLQGRFVSLDDPAAWSGSPLNSDAIYMLVEGGPPFHKVWSPLTTFDDPSVWSGSPLNADSLFMLVEKGAPFFKSWSFNVNDDPAVWSGSPLNAKVIRDLTAAGQPPTPRYSFYLWDDPPPWQATIYRDLSMATITPEPLIPDITRFWSYDDPAVWSGSPLHSWVIPELTQQTPIIPDIGRFWSYDDPAVWSGSPLRSDIISELTQGGQPPMLMFRFNSYDDAAFWQIFPYRNNVAGVPQPAPTVPLIARFVTYDDAAFWVGAPVHSNFLAVTPEEYIPNIARFESYDDPSVWSGSPLHSWLIPELTQGGQPPTLVFRFVSLDDAAVWQATTYRNNVATVPPPAPFVPDVGRFVSYDDPAFWQGTPTASFTLPIFIRGGPPIVPNNFRFASYDDAAFWAGAPVSAQTLSLLILGGSPGVPLVWRFSSLDDPPPWQIFPYRNLATGFVIPPFLPMAWGFGQSGTFGQDDATTWNATPLASFTMTLLTGGGRPFSVTYATGAVQGNYDVAESAWAFQAPFNLAIGTVTIPPPTFSNQSTFFVMSAFAFGYDSGQGQWNWAPPISWSQIIPPPPIITGIFTVSGPTVVDLFDPVTGVTYTWSPTQRRTA